jgi:hypothetical protein
MLTDWCSYFIGVVGSDIFNFLFKLSDSFSTPSGPRYRSTSPVVLKYPFPVIFQSALHLHFSIIKDKAQGNPTSVFCIGINSFQAVEVCRIKKSVNSFHTGRIKLRFIILDNCTAVLFSYAKVKYTVLSYFNVFPILLTAPAWLS